MIAGTTPGRGGGRYASLTGLTHQLGSGIKGALRHDKVFLGKWRYVPGNRI